MTNNLFDALGLKKAVIKAIRNIGYIAPTLVQAELIPAALNGEDALASAQTGSGKTSAYTIPILDYLLGHDEKTALIVAPTRELAQQIQTVFKQLAAGTDINTALITGGKNMQGQLRKLKTEPRVIIGTPGRLNDHLKRKSLKLNNTAIVVWDETDRMMDLGFLEQIEEIISFLPEQKQSLMLSATFPPKVLKLAGKYLNNPRQIIIGQLNNPSENVEQKNIRIEGNDKLKVLTQTLKDIKGQALVFVKTQRAAAEITRYLKKNLFDAGALHGGLKQKDRDAAVKGFREQGFKILIATDVAARGLDIPSISTVINYEFPQNPEEYIHRLGRTGRYDKTGICINLIARADRPQWKIIREFLQSSKDKEQHLLPIKPDVLPEENKQQNIKAEEIIQEKKTKEIKSAKKTTIIKEEKKAEEKISAKVCETKKAIKEVCAEKIIPQKEIQKTEEVKPVQEEYVFTPFKKVYVGKPAQENKEKPTKKSLNRGGNFKKKKPFKKRH